MVPSSPSFGMRAAVALGSLVGFYLLALSIVGFFGGLIWLDVVVAGKLHLKLLLAAGFVIYAVVRGVFFQHDAWSPPGPEITEAQEPGLFAAIREVAGRMDARMPRHVYLIPDVNAFVAEVGGFMGLFGTRRVMGIGVGMLSTDSVSELKATIAHEFGHFAGGDTRLGGLLYRTRASIGRVVGNLGDAWTGKIFEWYGKLFLRLTQGISRQQELAADAWSVRLVGRDAHVQGLRNEGVGGVLFHEFLEGEVRPVVEEGCVPANLFEGFRTFSRNLGNDGVAARLEARLHETPTDPYDSHPALSERIAYAAALPDPGVVHVEDAPARTLLVDPDAVERRITRDMLSGVRGENGTPPREVGWSEVGTVYAARFSRQARFVRERGIADLDDLLHRLTAGDALALARSVDDEVRDQDGARRVLSAVGTALVTAAAEHAGFEVTTEPGRPIFVVGPSGEAINPRELLDPAIADPALVPALRERLASLGLLREERAAS